jgi:hypothetical protein
MGKTAQTGRGVGRGVWIGAGIAAPCLAAFMLIWSGLGSATKQPEEGKAMGRSAAATVTPAARPPIDLAAPAVVQTATFALG